MKALVLIRDELWGLFVDDGVFAGAIVLWLLIGWGVLPRLVPPPGCRRSCCSWASRRSWCSARCGRPGRGGCKSRHGLAEYSEPR